jgi:hypothetical protein
MEQMESQILETVPCIFCQHPINPLAWDWKCPCCGHFNAHGNCFKNCEMCAFSPSRLPCPACKREFDFMVLLGNYGVYDMTNLPIYGLPEELMARAARLFVGVTFTFHRVVRSLFFYEQKIDEQDQLWFHAWMFGTETPDLDTPGGRIGQISFVYRPGAESVSLCHLQP